MEDEVWDSERAEHVVRRSCVLCGLSYYPRRWWATLQVAIRGRYRYRPKTAP